MAVRYSGRPEVNPSYHDVAYGKTGHRESVQVTRKDATEPPFDNAYWNSKAQGIYVDIVSGEPIGGKPWINGFLDLTGNMVLGNE